jgi:drug/metabolite transporter (DMT)-like permease
MIFLRFLAFFAGALMLVAPPIVLSDVHTRGMPGWFVLAGLAGLAVMAGSFFYVALAARYMRRSAPLRTLGGALLAAPAAAGLAVFWTRTQPQLLWCAALLLSVTALLFICFVFPATSNRRQRPMRGRDRPDTAFQLH